MYLLINSSITFYFHFEDLLNFNSIISNDNKFSVFINLNRDIRIHWGTIQPTFVWNFVVWYYKLHVTKCIPAPMRTFIICHNVPNISSTWP